MKSFAYKFGIIVGTIGLVSGCGSSSGSSVSGATTESVSGSVQKEDAAGTGYIESERDSELKNVKEFSNNIKDVTDGSALYQKMKEISESPEFSEDMIFTVDIYHKDKWWSSRKMVYSSSLDRFLVYGVRKHADGSENPIRYSLQDFKDYYNKGDDREFKFKDVSVASEKYISDDNDESIRKMFKNKDLDGLTKYVKNVTSGKNLYYRMKALSGWYYFHDLVFTVDIYYHENGKDGPMKWFYSEPMKFDDKLDRFVVDGVKTTGDRTIKYDAKEFDDYYNSGNEIYSFENVQVDIAKLFPIKSMIENNDTSGLTEYVNGGVNGKEIFERMKHLLLDTESFWWNFMFKATLKGRDVELQPIVYIILAFRPLYYDQKGSFLGYYSIMYSDAFAKYYDSGILKNLEVVSKNDE